MPAAERPGSKSKQFAGPRGSYREEVRMTFEFSIDMPGVQRLFFRSRSRMETLTIS